jgi:Domain of unknown function (DUF6457)
MTSSYVAPTRGSVTAEEAEPGGRGTMEWPERYAMELARIQAEADPDLSPREVGAMLRLSREVAHRTERKWAPVATYLAGRFVAVRRAAGVPLSAALEEATRAAESLLLEPEEDPSGP